MFKMRGLMLDAKQPQNLFTFLSKSYKSQSRSLHVSKRRFQVNNGLSKPPINDLRPKPLRVRTVVGLIAFSSTFTMAFYLGYQLRCFMKSSEDSKSIFLPLWINFNVLFKNRYTINSLKYVDDVDIEKLQEGFNKRIHFKILNLLVNNKIVGNNGFMNWNYVDMHLKHCNYYFQMNCPTVSGIEFVATKPKPKTNNDETHQPLNVDYSWSIKLFDLNLFLLNQPAIEFRGISYKFDSNFTLIDIHSSSPIGYITIDGTIENNNIMFENVILKLDSKDYEYKVL